MITFRAHDLAALAGVVDPQSVNNSSVSSDWIDLSKFRAVLFVLMAGATDTTIDFKLQEAKDASGTGAQDIPGRSISALSGADDNKQAAIAVNGDQITRNSGYRFVRGVANLGNGSTGGVIAVAALGLCPRYGPAVDSRHPDCVQVVG